MGCFSGNGPKTSFPAHKNLLKGSCSRKKVIAGVLRPCSPLPLPQGISALDWNMGSMRVILFVGFLVVCLVLASGCVTTTSSEKPAESPAKTPDLVGNWSGTMDGYVGGQGFNHYPGAAMTMRVTEQKGRVFMGSFFFANTTGATKTVEFGGVVNHDGRTVTIVEQNGGYSWGTLLGPDEIELVHADDQEPSDIAIDSLRRR